jgi:hypothetical protein
MVNKRIGEHIILYMVCREGDEASMHLGLTFAYLFPNTTKLILETIGKQTHEVAKKLATQTLPAIATELGIEEEEART